MPEAVPVAIRCRRSPGSCRRTRTPSARLSTGSTRTLNERGVACPSVADPGRNRHRRTSGWTVRSIAAILTNPRYTGYQVWNRQRADHDPTSPGALNAEAAVVRRWNPTDSWAISNHPAHAALVTEEDFIAAQTVKARPQPDTNETAALPACRVDPLR